MQYKLFYYFKQYKVHSAKINGCASFHPLQFELLRFHGTDQYHSVFYRLPRSHADGVIAAEFNNL